MHTWLNHIPLLQTGYHHKLLKQVSAIRQHKTVYPPADRVLYALEVTPFSGVQVVILGQDPYHGQGQAHGLAFSVPDGVKAPPSLRNIFKEIQDDIYRGVPQALSTDLTRWAQQGVLLLNTSLTVEAGRPGSHQSLGWQILTDQIVERLSQERDHLAFMLWGSLARSKLSLIDPEKHLVLESPHPSPLSAYRGFWGCKHFSQANQYLKRHGGLPVEW